MLARLLSAASALLLGACSVIGVRSGTEEPRFEVLERRGEVEIRRYAPRLAAATTVAAPSEDAARSEGFRRLAGYIFGGNHGRTKIAMTAPVAQASERIAMTVPVGQEAAGEAGSPILHDDCQCGATAWKFGAFLAGLTLSTSTRCTCGRPGGACMRVREENAAVSEKQTAT